MIITSTRRSQRQIRSSFLDAFEARQVSTTSSRRVRSEQFQTAVRLEHLPLSSGTRSSSPFDLNFSNETTKDAITQLTEDFANFDKIPTKEFHFSRLFYSFQGDTAVAEPCITERASQPSRCSIPTSDVLAWASTKIPLNVCSNIASGEKVTARRASDEIQHLLDTLRIKSPAQKEWEQLWYHGLESAYQKVAASFPEAESLPPNPIPDESISEPVLNISGLKQEDRRLFEQEEKSHKQTFVANTEAERLARLQRAGTAVNAQERIALLLGLPTYDQYVTSKLRVRRKENETSSSPSKRQQRRQARFAEKRQHKADRLARQSHNFSPENTDGKIQITSVPDIKYQVAAKTSRIHSQAHFSYRGGMSHQQSQDLPQIPIGGAEHRPLVVGLTKPPSIRSASTMASSADAAALNKEIAENVKENTTAAAPSEDNPTAPPASKPKKEKAPKQPKPPKAAPITAPTAPALIDLRVGHILRAIAHPNADSLYVSTIAMGDPEGTEHTQVDEETGKVVRTVCSGLNGLVPLEEMQDRKIIVVANLKPVNMRSIKSAAMVLAASPKQPEGADPHAPDRVVELVTPPDGSEAGDKVYFEGWPYGEGKGPEKQLNPKKKQWEAIQPGFYTSEDLVVGFDASQCDEVEGDSKGNLIVEGKGACTVKTLKGAVVR